MIQNLQDEGQTILCGGRLFQQCIIDEYATTHNPKLYSNTCLFTYL